MKINNVPVTKLKEHKKASKLIPMMTGKEWDDFLESVKKEGVRQPLDINEKYEVLDGRHRLKAAKELEIETLQVIKRNFTDDEAIKFVRDTAIERRSLTPAQRLNIVLETEEVINSIYEEGRNKISETRKMEQEVKKGHLSSTEERWKQPHNSVEQIAEIAGMSESQVSRAKKLKKENPDAYKEVVDGKKSLYKAYNDLPTVVNKQAKLEGFKKSNPSTKVEQENKKEIERGDADVKKEEVSLKPKQYNQQPPELSPEEIERQMFNANVKTFFRHLEELAGFAERTERFEEVVGEAIKQDSSSMIVYAKSLEKTINLLKTEV